MRFLIIINDGQEVAQLDHFITVERNTPVNL
jgi:hypothetical protein